MGILDREDVAGQQICDRAREQSAVRIAQAVDPYSRFVRAEQARWAEARAALRDRASSFRDNWRRSVGT